MSTVNFNQRSSACESERDLVFRSGQLSFEFHYLQHSTRADRTKILLFRFAKFVAAGAGHISGLSYRLATGHFPAILTLPWRSISEGRFSLQGRVMN